jgi:hypothetical protein
MTVTIPYPGIENNQAWNVMGIYQALQLSSFTAPGVPWFLPRTESGATFRVSTVCERYFVYVCIYLEYSILEGRKPEKAGKTSSNPVRRQRMWPFGVAQRFKVGGTGVCLDNGRIRAGAKAFAKAYEGSRWPWFHRVNVEHARRSGQ